MQNRPSRRAPSEQIHPCEHATQQWWRRRLCAVLLVLAMLVVLWFRLIPMFRSEPALQYRGDDGRQHVYLGDYDSYVWLRNARNYLRTGTTCDAIVDGQCRDTYEHAPVGAEMIYNRSLHIAAIVAVHRLLTALSPGFPLPSSSYLVPVIVGVLGVVPAFAIGWRLAGSLAGLAAALLIGVNPVFLQRSLGSDNDVWNVVLPLFMVWAAIEALHARSRIRQTLCAALCGVTIGLHAATWAGWQFTYVVLFAGLLINVAVQVLRAIRGHGWRVWQAAEVRGAVLTFAVFYVATAICVAVAGRGGEYFDVPLGVVRWALPEPSPRAAAAEESTTYWPDVMSTVSELTKPNLGRIGRQMAGSLFFFIGWLGLLVLLLPRSTWSWWHFVVLIAGNYLYRYLLTADVSRLTLVALLALPLAVTMLLYAFADDDPPAGGRGLGLLIAVWFLGAIFLSYQGLRFVMLFVPPFAIAFAVAIGRLQQWLSAKIASMRLSSSRPLQIVTWLALAAVLVQPVRQGYATVRAYAPRMNDAWWDTLTTLRDTTPPDAIVNTWWDYGYFAKYVAERRVSAAGGSLKTHIPSWLARALLAADERESVGLLRMLNCGSDATPLPEGRYGAYGKLVGYGIDEITAHDVVVDLARLDAEPARALLAVRGLSASAQADVLRSTHCDPPAAYVVLTSEMIATSLNWSSLGSWDLRRAYLARRVHELPESELLGVLTTKFGYGADEAQRLYREAAKLGPADDPRVFAASPSRLVTSQWVPCRQQDDGRLLCPSGARADRTGLVLDSVVYPPGRPGESRLRFRQPGRRGGQTALLEKAPASILVADDNGVSTMTPAAPEQSEFALLIDTAHARVLVGTPTLLASTFVRLMFLDGRTPAYFEKVADRSGFGGERVVTWRVNWPGRRSPG